MLLRLGALVVASPLEVTLWLRVRVTLMEVLRVRVTLMVRDTDLVRVPEPDLEGEVEEERVVSPCTATGSSSSEGRHRAGDRAAAAVSAEKGAKWCQEVGQHNKKISSHKRRQGCCRETILNLTVALEVGGTHDKKINFKNSHELCEIKRLFFLCDLCFVQLCVRC